MWHQEKKKPANIVYDDEQKEQIATRVVDIMSLNPGMSFREAQVREIISRYRGDSGLSRHAVDYLTECIMKVLDN